jgi:sulfide:quinone oxidoreductase
MGAGSHHRVVVVGGGTGGISVAATLRRLGISDIAILEPSERHFYQPLWTLVGAGAVRAENTVRDQRRCIPPGVAWIKEAAAELDPDGSAVTTASGTRLGYDFLVLAPGLELNWDAIAGLRDSVRAGNVSTNYDYDLAPRTWDMIRNLRGGVALFHMPGTPIKCPGAPQKIMYLAADHFRRRGVLRDTTVIYGCGAPSIYGIAEYAAVLNRVIERYGIDARYGHELVEVRSERKEAIFQRKDGAAGDRVAIPYDILHVAPPSRAPGFVRMSALADPAKPAEGWVPVDKFTMQHVRYANVFALGDVAGTPNSKTGAAASRQAQVVAHNLAAVMSGREPIASYNGYVACPIVTAYGKMLLCEFDYSGKPTPTIPFIDTFKERYDMWLLKRYGLPWIYWNFVLKGYPVPFLHRSDGREAPAPVPSVAK